VTKTGQFRAGWIARESAVEDAVAELTQRGVAVVRNLFGMDRIESLTDESMRLCEAQEANDPHSLRFGIRRDFTGGATLEHIDPVIDISGPFRRLNDDPRLLAIAEAHLGEQAIVMREELIYKWPGTNGHDRSRDESQTIISGVPEVEVLTMSVALDPVTEDTGPTEFYPDLRLTGSAAPRDTADGPDAGDGQPMRVAPFSPQMDPGDVVLFDALVPHHSDMNRSEHPSRSYRIHFVPARYPQARANYYAGRLRAQQEERAPLVGGHFFFT